MDRSCLSSIFVAAEFQQLRKGFLDCHHGCGSYICYCCGDVDLVSCRDDSLMHLVEPVRGAQVPHQDQAQLNDQFSNQIAKS